MSEIKWGLISQTDANGLMSTIDRICYQSAGIINVLEIGVYAGQTGKGIIEYLVCNNRDCFVTGIDNNKDGEEIRFQYDKLIIGDSKEVYHQIENESQHMIILDGCHCYTCVIADSFAYADKLKVGGYICYHDSAKHIKPFKDFQHGDPNNPLAYISVREALTRMGMFGGVMVEKNESHLEGTLSQWGLIYDEADAENEAGGFTIFKKMF